MNDPRRGIHGEPSPRRLEKEYEINAIVALAHNENPLGPSPKAVEAMSAQLWNVHRYPEEHGRHLVNALARNLWVEPEQIILGNGSDEVIEMLARRFLQPGDEVILPEPAFHAYEASVKRHQAVPVGAPLGFPRPDVTVLADRITPRTRMVFLSNPANPTGGIITKGDMEAFLEPVSRDAVVVLDEAYIEFVRDKECARGLDFLYHDNTVVVLRTFSKLYGLAGLRVGYGVARPEIVAALEEVRLKYNTNALAHVAAAAALGDEEHITRTLLVVDDGLTMMYEVFDAMGLDYARTQTNFVLVDVGQSATSVVEAMARQGVYVRDMTNYGLPGHIRVSVGLEYENQRFLEVLGKVLG
ncbi:MAG: histidinol-phosphate transaminase [Desulfatibacillaceae bacterium]